jgi:ABC-type Fe3+ transport system substrate-binding protein
MTIRAARPPAASLSRRRFLALNLAALGATTTWSTGWPRRARADEAALAQAARAEGKVSLYSVIPQNAAQGFVDRFTARYGIAIDYQRLTSGPLGQRFAAEATSGNMNADVLIMTDRFFMEDAAAKNWLGDLGDVPAAAGLAASYKTPNFATVALLPHGLAYNTGVLKSAPESWDVLLDPQWKGRVVLLDPRNGFFTSVFYYALLKAKGDVFLRQIAAQATMVTSSVQGVQQVAAGSAALCAPAYPNLLPPLTKSGAPVDLVMLDPVVASDNFAAVAAKAPHPNAARLLLNYALTPEGQALINKDTSSPLGTFPGTYPLPQTVIYDAKEVQAAQSTIFNLLGVG